MPYDFSQTLPAIDQNLCNVWSEEDQNKYNKLPYYLVKGEAEVRRHWQTWTSLLTDTIPWQPNMGDTMKMVIVEDSPFVRQFARPNRINVEPLEDIFNVNERTTDATLAMHDFSSPHFRFLPSFQDFMKGNLVPSRKNLEKQIMFFEDTFYRTFAFDWAPNVYFAGLGVESAPVGASSKTSAWLAPHLSQMSGSGYLTFEELFKALSVFEDEIGATPYEGPGTPSGTSAALNERFALLCSPQAWNQFVNDPWVKENRPINMNIVTESFKGDIFGRIRAKLERFPIRMAADADFAVTFPAQEIRETNSDAADYNRTKPNPAYTKLDQAQFEIAWLIGGRHMRRIESGPPPSFFAGAANDPGKLAGMTWNGQINATRNFLIPGKDADGNAQYKTNSRGRYVKFESALTVGCIGPHMFNIMPIVFRRRNGVSTTGVASA